MGAQFLFHVVADQNRQAELLEALKTSALTALPVLVDPNAIEPVMTLVTSPAWFEKPLLIATAKPPTVFEPHTVTLQDGRWKLLELKLRTNQ